MNIWGKLLGIQDPTKPAPCSVGVGTHADDCPIIVAPGRGVQYGGVTYCSDEHAVLAQQEQIM